DITAAEYSQEDEHWVRVTGSRWVDQRYTIKLEGIKRIGYRTITIAGMRDPNLLRGLDGLVETARDRAKDKFRGVEFTLAFHQFGKNAVLGDAEPMIGAPIHEV